MNEYYYCMVKCNLVDNGENGLKPDLPCMNHSFVGVYSDGKLTNGSLSSQERINEPAIAWIHVKKEDEATIKAFEGYIGDDKATIQANSDLQSYYPYKVKDLKNKYNDDGELIEEYTGDDAEEQAIFCCIES